MICSRRSFVTLVGALAASGARMVEAQETTPEAPYSDEVATDAWIQHWMQSPQASTQELHLGRFADRIYFLRQKIGWSPNPGQEAHKPVQVPVGFVTDFTSIPRAFWSLLPPDGQYTYPAIVHDYLYWEQPVSREEADLIFKLQMEDFEVGAGTIGAIYSGVRLGGGVAWKNNAKLKAAGEKRVLKAFPSDPKTKWSEWKLKPDVF